MIEESPMAGPSSPTATRLIDQELLRVRGEIIALQAEEADLVTALRVLDRLAPEGSGGILTVDEMRDRLDGAATASSLLWGPTATSSDDHGSELANSGVIDVGIVEQSESDEHPAAEPEVEVEPIPPAEPPPPRKVAPAKEFRPTGAELAKRILAEVEARGITKKQASLEIFSQASQLAALEKQTGRPVQAATLEKVEAWLAAPPAARADPTGATLAAEIDALIAAEGLSKAAIGQHLFNNTNGVEYLRAHEPRRKTVARVRAFLNDPPLDKVRLKVPLGDRRYMANKPKADPTQAPETPLLDERDRQEGRAARKTASVNRDNAREAEKRLNGEKVGRVESPGVRAAKRAILDTRAAEHRQTDPVEQAKLALQRRGRTVYSASVTGGRKDRFIVSGQDHQLTPAELIALAEKVTGQSFRRAA